MTLLTSVLILMFASENIGRDVANNGSEIAGVQLRQGKKESRLALALTAPTVNKELMRKSGDTEYRCNNSHEDALVMFFSSGEKGRIATGG